MIVRRLLPGDEQLAADIVNAVKPADERDGDVDARYMASFLADESNYLVAAYEEDGTPVGFAFGYSLPRIDRPMNMMYVYEVGVVEGRRNQGIGKAIMTEMVRICRDEGFMEMFVITGRENTPAMRLYSRSGGIAADDEQAVIFCWDF
jgi:GNAT superfamily N-acetyltransferase